MDLFGIHGYNLEERLKLVMEQGTVISTRSTDRYTICLYHMGDFFAEIWQHLRTNKIVLVRGFNDKADLEPYLHSIDVSALIQ